MLIRYLANQPIIFYPLYKWFDYSTMALRPCFELKDTLHLFLKIKPIWEIISGKTFQWLEAKYHFFF